MLVQFKVKNYLSFKDEAVFDLSAIKSYKEHEYNLIDLGLKDKFLKVAAIYGANASGKSNLYKAMKSFQQIVMESFNNVENNDKLVIDREYKPFKFCNEDSNSEFEIVFIVNSNEYKYGYEYNNKNIVSEWLYKKSCKTNRTSIIFERYKSEITFGSSIKAYCDIYKEQVNAETLVLSFFNRLKLKTKIFGFVFEGVMSTLVTGSSIYERNFLINIYLVDILKNNKENFLQFLNSVDTGIEDVTYKEAGDDIEFYAHHTGEDGKDYTLDLFNESEGTLKVICIYINARMAIRWDKSLFVDELNSKLHPLLLKFIIDLFHSEKNESAQLIYTTHDTTLLDKKFLRRDQIWFVEKNQYGHSKLMALSDFKIRTDASFEKDYLSGVYGGIPYIKEMDL